MPKGNTAKPLAQHQTLTAYEAWQLAQIAAWKSESRGVAKRLLRTVAGPSAVCSTRYCRKEQSNPRWTG